MCVVCFFLIDVKHLFITLQIIVAALHSVKIDDNSSYKRRVAVDFVKHTKLDSICFFK